MVIKVHPAPRGGFFTVRVGEVVCFGRDRVATIERAVRAAHYRAQQASLTALARVVAGVPA